MFEKMVYMGCLMLILGVIWIRFIEPDEVYPMIKVKGEDLYISGVWIVCWSLFTIFSFIGAIWA